MPRFKYADYEQTRMVAISYGHQIVPGSFEYTLFSVIDTVDLSIFHWKYNNDEKGANAYSPAILLKIILYAYSRGINTSRKIEQCCRENVMFMALSADARPDHSTIASFVSGMHDEIVHLFQSVLRICFELDLISGTMFAIDGCKLSSNASKEWSGTKENLRIKREKLKAAIDYMVERHIANDSAAARDDSDEDAFQARIDKAMAKVDRLDTWLDANEDKKGYRGRTKQSIVTDNESAKMKCSRGVIQGYNNIAVVDDKHQIIVHARAHGTSDDAQLLRGSIEGTRDNLRAATGTEQPLQNSRVAADTGFHNIDNCAFLESEGIDGYVPDSNFRKRDPRFTSAHRHKKDAHKRFERYEQSDFTYDKVRDCYICPMGKRLRYYAYMKNHSGLYRGRRYQANPSDCSVCASRSRCLKGLHAHARRLMVVDGTISSSADAVVAMRKKVDTVDGRQLYSRRMGIIEPVFGNIVSNKGLDKLTVRGEIKATIQWNLYSMVHNIEKIWRCGKMAYV